MSPLSDADQLLERWGDGEPPRQTRLHRGLAVALIAGGALLLGAAFAFAVVHPRAAASMPVVEQPLTPPPLETAPSAPVEDELAVPVPAAPRPRPPAPAPVKPDVFESRL